MLNLGRTWRMGPEPEYLAAWYSPSAGLERLDEWEPIFRSGEAARFEEPFRLAARIDRAGCTSRCSSRCVGSARPLLRRVLRGRAGRHARRRARRLRGARGAARRARAEPPLRPHRRARPRPARARVLGHALVAALDAIARELDGAEHPIRLVTAALYNDFGQRRSERMRPPLAADGRGVIVAVDHPLYSWPCRGLEDRDALLGAVVSAGADAVIVSYGTLRDCRAALGEAAPILKLDLTR